MKKKILWIVMAILSYTVAEGKCFITVGDSVGVSTINGRKHVKYKVESGETIYRIATAYKVSATELLEINPELQSGLKIGQIIQLPYNHNLTYSKRSTPASSKIESQNDSYSSDVTDSETIAHLVQPGETLYGIARKYGVAFEDIKDQNGWDLKAGEEVLVKLPTKVPASTENQLVVKEDKKKTQSFDPFIHVDQKEQVITEPVKQGHKKETLVKATNTQKSEDSFRMDLLKNNSHGSFIHNGTDKVVELSFKYVILDFFYKIINFINTCILIFAIVLLICYLTLSIISLFASFEYLYNNRYTDYSSILSSTYAPSVSLIAPAYNEGANIIENVRSLLSIHYNNYQVVIVNDGSKDDTLEKLIKAYELEKINYHINEQIKTKPVRGIYKSRKPVFHNLIVIDKVNGGKADALNVGLNISANKYVACIDVDCVLEQDALLKLVKPFMEEGKNKVIATGGVIRIANSCQIMDGKLVEVNFPSKFLPRVQTLEYIRAFLLGRMAWAKLDGLLIISGAFGMFDKKIAILAGGYNHNTVGEDMELVVRMRRYMHDTKQKYRVEYIPDPLCWTEAPETYKILGRQRNRWTRGTIETLYIHKKLFMNPKYGTMGIISYPFWLFFEWLAPIIEFFGLFYFMLLAFLGLVNWVFFFTLLAAVYTFAIMFSVFAIFMEEFTFHQYKRKREMFKLIQTAILEPLLFHPFVVWAAICGNIDIIKGKKSWGEMTRKGLTPKA